MPSMTWLLDSTSLSRDFFGRNMTRRKYRWSRSEVVQDTYGREYIIRDGIQFKHHGRYGDIGRVIVTHYVVTMKWVTTTDSERSHFIISVYVCVWCVCVGE